MTRFATVLVASFAAACATAAPPAAPATPAAPAAAAPAAPVVAAPAASFDAAWLVGGTWVARQSETPIGAIPFAFEFKRESDGSVHAHTGDDKRYVDLRFSRAQGGGWQLDESAELPGVGAQTYTLLPAAATATDVHEWRAVAKPDFLAVRVSRHGDDAMTFAVLLRGQPHVRFELERVGGGTASSSMGR